MSKDGKKQFKRGVQWLVWSGMLTVASVGGWLVYGQFINRPAEPVPVRVIKVKKDTVENPINESGTVELGSQQKLTSPAEGTIEEVRVKVGSHVESGQELIVLRNPDRQTILTKNELDVQQQDLVLTNNRQKVNVASEKIKIAEQNYQTLVNRIESEKQTELDDLQLRTQQKESAIANNRQKVVTASESLAAEQRKLQAEQKLFDRGFISENEL